MITRSFFLICALCTGTLFGSLEDHFKRATDKGSGHRIKNVDFIYMINLDERPEKLESSLKQLRPYGIDPYRFSAVNGWSLSIDEINDIGVKFSPEMTSGLAGTCYLSDANGPTYEEVAVPGRTYFCYDMAKGTIGIALSHLSILQDALKSGYKTIWVMEDDISVVQDPRLVSGYIEKLDKLVGQKGWDLLFTDLDTISNETGEYVPCLALARRPNFIPKNPERFAERVVLNSDFRKIGSRYGMYSVIIRRSGMIKILDFLKKYNLFYPIDIEFSLPDDIKVYTVMDDIVSTQRYAPSDNSKPGYGQP